MEVIGFVLYTLNNFIKSYNESENWIIGEQPLENDAVYLPYSSKNGV